MVTDEMVKAAQRESGDLLHPDVMREALEAALSQVSAVPREPTDLAPEIIAFAYLMQRQLDRNSHKDSKGERGWKNDDPKDLAIRVVEEAEELKGEAMVMPVPSAAKVRDEAADVANMAMMVVDAMGALNAIPTTAGQRDRLVAALIVLARYGVPADIQEMLVMGSTNLAVAPGAFEEAVHAYTNERG